MMNRSLAQKVAAFANGERRLMVLTGAGISAESGIPTFRGEEGYWRVGSKEYHPQEMATHRMFSENFDAVWAWYLYRRSVCCKASPNSGHRAVRDMEALFPGRFSLVTQNVDGLHVRAGSAPGNTYEIHGNIFRMRCAVECSGEVYQIPEDIPEKGRGDSLTDSDRKLLRCSSCGKPARPHILWFDECYNETHYRYETVLEHASRTGLLLVAGASGSTTLPLLAAEKVLAGGGMLVDINVGENPFSRLAVRSGGAFIRGNSSDALPAFCALLRDAMTRTDSGKSA